MSRDSLSLNLVSKIQEKSIIKRVSVQGLHVSLNSLQADILELTKMANLDNLRFLARGRILDPSLSLSEGGLKGDNATIYVLRDPGTSEPMPTDMNGQDPSEEERNQFSLAFGIAIASPVMKKVVKRLTEKENLESLAATCPSLAGDPIAVALLSRPETLISLMNPDVLNNMYKKPPALIQACENLMAVVHEEDQSAKTGRDLQGSAISSFAYHLDDMSDVEDEDDDEDGGAMGLAEQGGVARNASFSAITPDQLAAAIMAAQNPQNAGSFASPPPPPPRQGSGSTSGHMSLPRLQSTSSSATTEPSPGPLASPNITSDMFRQAMEQAMRGANTTAASSSAPTPAQILDQKVAQMKEMGCTDETVARNALNIMDGDVQAAVDLILSGWDGKMEEN